MHATCRHRRRPQLISFVLILLLLLSQMATASEVSAHAPCDQDGGWVLVELGDPESPGADDRAPDQSAHDHICHVHPPAHSLPAGALQAKADRPTQEFPPFLVALTDLTTAPPVPPPNA